MLPCLVAEKRFLRHIQKYILLFSDFPICAIVELVENYNLMN